MSYSGISDAEARELLKVIVETPSINPAFMQPGDDPRLFGEARIARALADWCARSGLEVEFDEALPDRPNLIVRAKGAAGGPAMLWEGHLDTVQVTGMADPFTPTIRNGNLYGRGAVDDGGCVAAFLLAMRAFASAPPPGDVTFVGAVDEEFNYKGVLHHLARGEHATLGIAGEPTSLRVVRACKGCVRWEVEISGRSAHSSKPHEGVSAISAGKALLAAYDREMETRTEVHALVGPSTLTCTAFHGGEGPNTVPSKSVLRFDYRYLPSEDGMTVWARFRDVAIEMASAYPGIRVAVHDPFVDSSAMDVPADADIVTRMGAVCAAHGIEAGAIGVPYGSDATKMVNISAIPTIVFGPGNIDQAHAIDEHVEIAQVTQAARMLVDLAHGLG
ncbi:M20 family metallopeptidase [Pelagibacterium montanilacus]|uniref:M20 family metallopeptidase n=1 Tax=Pelagibacterium montanilacus TaxID=2185280 RepID=UPI000F8EEA00|nr:M20/M25/M40 family metallo-hydrolase [Pelagibacterium montanilacus]